MKYFVIACLIFCINFCHAVGQETNDSSSSGADFSGAISSVVTEVNQRSVLKNDALKKKLRINKEALYLKDQIFGRSSEYLATSRLLFPSIQGAKNDLVGKFQGQTIPGQRRSSCPVCPDDDEASETSLLQYLAYELKIPPQDKFTLTEFTLTNKDYIVSGKFTPKNPVLKSFDSSPSEIYANSKPTYLIEEMHKELNNPGFLYDTYRFGGVVNYLDDPDVLAAQLGLRVYPAYHRHLEGQFFDTANLLRRVSLMASVGPGITEGHEGPDLEGLVYTAGFGFDLTHEATLMFGWSFYNTSESVMGDDGSDAERSMSETSFTVGLSLNSELFENFLKR